MITSALLVAAVALCSVTSSFGAPIPTTRDTQTLGRRVPTPYAADSPDLVARHPVAAPVAAPVDEARRFPRRIYYERYAKRDEAKVNINEVVARSPEPVAAPAPAKVAASGPSLIAREHAEELERRMKKRQLRRRFDNKDLFKRTLEREGVQKRRVDPITKREAAPGENPSIKSRAFVPPKDIESRDVYININTGKIIADVSKEIQVDGNTVGDSGYGSSSSSTGPVPTQSSPLGQQGPSGQSSGTPSTPTGQTGNQDPNASSSSVATSSTGAPTPGAPTPGGTSTSTATTTTQTVPSQSGSTGTQQPPTGSQQPPTGQQPPANQPPANQQPPVGSTWTSTGSSMPSGTPAPPTPPVMGGNDSGSSTSSSTPSSPSQTTTQNSGNKTQHPKRGFSIFEERSHARNFKRVVPAENLVKRSSTLFKRDV